MLCSVTVGSIVFHGFLVDKGGFFWPLAHGRLLGERAQGASDPNCRSGLGLTGPDGRSLAPVCADRGDGRTSLPPPYGLASLARAATRQAAAPPLAADHVPEGAQPSDSPASWVPGEEPSISRVLVNISLSATRPPQAWLPWSLPRKSHGSAGPVQTLFFRGSRRSSENRTWWTRGGCTHSRSHQTDGQSGPGGGRRRRAPVGLRPTRF